jgi:DNA mismatch repair protein MutS2
MGRSYAEDLVPAFSEDEVWLLLEQTGEALTILDKGGLSLRGVHDVTQQLELAAKEAVLEGTVLWRIGRAVKVSREAGAAIDAGDTPRPRLRQLGERLGAWPEVERVLTDYLDTDGSVKSSASPELASARAKITGLSKRIVQRIQAYTSGRYRALLSDPIYTQRSGRYVIPLKAENKGKVKGIVHDASATGATIYVEPDDVVKAGNELRTAEAKEKAEELRVLRQLSNLVGEHAKEIIETLDALGDLDVILAKARLALGMNACMPTKWDGPVISIEHGRHPLLDPKEAIPLSLELGTDYNSILITGPNTGGKTVAIKTVGLFAAMAQSGMLLPAEAVRMGAFTQMWADIGDEQSIHQSLSTFSSHIKNISDALKGLKPGALVLLDEAGAGTDPAEGAALARALLLSFQKGGAMVFASTHYGELKVFASSEPGFVNASMEFDRKSLRPTYQLSVGTPGSSHALKIAERYGIPKSVIGEAEAGITVGERDIAEMIESLEHSQKRAREAQSRADRLAAQMERMERKAEEKSNKAIQASQSARTNAAADLEEMMRELRLEASDIFDELKSDASQAGIDRARKRLKTLQSRGGEAAAEAKSKQAAAKAPPKEKLVKGARVKMRGLGQEGTVIEPPKSGKVLVQAGPMKMQVKVNDLEILPDLPQRRSSKKTQAVARNKKETAGLELHLRMMRAEQAVEVLEKFLDDAILAGAPYLRIVHGKGGGVLREMTHRYLAESAAVESFREGDPTEGGQGVTIAKLV